ncbi:MAG: hypothetical protein ACI8TE_000166 [Francisella sp.]|jgi:hypothetical protein
MIMKSVNSVLTKVFAKTLIFVSMAILLQDCTSNSVENDFSYESLTDTVDGTPFRNRKYDYARVKVDEAPSLKIPAGLNGQSIKPKYKLPEGNNNFAKSQVPEAEKEMLPPNFGGKFDMNKIINDQISKVAISVVYDDKGALKLVFREPLQVTIELLDDYFKDQPNHYKIETEEDKVLSGHMITVKDTQKDILYVFKVRKVDVLSSLVTITAILKADGETLVDNYVDVGVGVLSKIRKDLNGKTISTKDQKLVAEITQTSAVAENKPKEKSSLGGLASAKSSISFGSYDRTIEKDKQNQEAESGNDDYAMVAVPKSGSQIYTSDAKPQVLNT